MQFEIPDIAVYSTLIVGIIAFIYQQVRIHSILNKIEARNSTTVTTVLTNFWDSRWRSIIQTYALIVYLSVVTGKFNQIYRYAIDHFKNTKTQNVSEILKHFMMNETPSKKDDSTKKEEEDHLATCESCRKDAENTTE